MDSTLIFASAATVLTLWLAWLTWHTLRYTRLRRALLSDPAIGQLEGLLAELLDRVGHLEANARRVDGVLETLRGEILQSLVAPVSLRYNAFEDITGSQSFSLAIVDRRGRGCLLTSLAGREGTRLYLKQILDGRTDASLSEEEASVLSDALASTRLP